MTKIKYPEDGLYVLVRDLYESNMTILQNACGNCEFHIPQDFEYRNYLGELLSKLNSFRTEFSKIISNVNLISQQMDTLSTELYEDVKMAFKTDSMIVKSRDKYIK